MAASDAITYMTAAEAATEIVLQKLEILFSCPERRRCLCMETQADFTKKMLAMILEYFFTQDRPSKSTEWLGRLLRAMYDAEEFIDKFYLREACLRHKPLQTATRPFAALVPMYMLRRDLSNLVKAMKDLCKDQYFKPKKGTEGVKKNEPDSSSSHASDPPQNKRSGRLTTFRDRQALANFIFHDAKKEEIMKRIREGAKSVDVLGISIYGEEGSGKTFLARWVCREAMYLGFDLCAWVHVSASADKQEFLLEILKQVDKLARDLMDFNEIKKMLRQKLSKTKRFLIVLDDVHRSDQQYLQELLMIIPFPSQGHIITTTRDSGIAWKMSSYEPIILQGFGQDEIPKMDAWKLHRGPHAQSLTDEDKVIINRCRGLPLCISLLSGLLSKAEEHQRTALLNDGSMLTLSNTLQLSYHRLPVYLKPCFIYMVLFPVAFPIPTRRLVRLWLAEGLLDSRCYNEERKLTRLPEDVGKTFILKLADRNVIDVVSWRADGSPKACQMVIPLREMIYPIAMSMGILHIHATQKSKDGNYHGPTSQKQQLLAQPQERNKIRWLAEHTNIVTDIHGSNYPKLSLSHVRSFLSFYLRRGVLTKRIGTFLRKMTSKTDYSLLRVLDLEGVYKPTLQGVLPKLVLLRYLGLRSTVLDSLPRAVADLHHLETLDIKHTNITSLPSSLWKARNLRHLHLNWFYIDFKNILKACSNNVNALTQLQTLSGLVIREVKENLMTGYKNSLTTLTTLKLFLQHSDTDTLGTAGKTIGDWISSRLTNLQSLTFGVIQEAKLAEESAKVAQPMEEAEPAEEVTKAAKPVKEAQPSKQATKKAERAEGAKVGPLPELSLAEKHDLLELYLLGQLNKPNWTQLLPVSLRVLTLSGLKVKADMMPELGGHLKQLRTFRLLANSFLGTSLRFAKDGFPSLMILKIWKLPRLEKMIIEQGAMSHLKELEFRRLDGMRHVDGINECKELENICVVVKKGAQGFVDDHDKGKEKTPKLYNIVETKLDESTDDDNSADDDEDASP